MVKQIILLREIHGNVPILHKTAALSNKRRDLVVQVSSDEAFFPSQLFNGM